MLFATLSTEGLRALSLYGNAALTVCFLVLLPWLVWKVIPAVRWLQPAEPFKWFPIGVFWAFGLLLVIDLVNTLRSGSQQPEIWVKAIAATGLMLALVFCHWKWRWLTTLYPEEDLVREQKRRERVLDKLEVCDQTMPLPRFESRRGVIEYGNDAAVSFFQVAPQDFVGMFAAALIHPDDVERVLREHILPNNHATYECRLLTSTGRICWCEIKSTHDPHDPQLRITYVSDVTRYVEERDRRIREQRAFLASQSHRQAADQLLRTVAQQLVG